MKSEILGLLAVGLLVGPMTASATLLGATVDISAENGFSGGNCKSASATGRTVGAGVELAGSDWTGGCVGYYSADLGGTSLTLTGIEGGNYSRASLLVQIVSGPAITGVSFDGYTPDFFQPYAPNNDTNFFPTISFGANFISIVWDTGDDNSQFFFNGSSNGFPPVGTALFSIATASVPEPGTVALLGLGLAGLGFARRRKSN